MDMQAEKIALAGLVSNTDDEDIVGQIKSLLQGEDESWENLPGHIAEGLKESKNQADGREFVPLDDVKNENSLLPGK